MMRYKENWTVKLKSDLKDKWQSTPKAYKNYLFNYNLKLIAINANYSLKIAIATRVRELSTITIRTYNMESTVLFELKLILK